MLVTITDKTAGIRYKITTTIEKYDHCGFNGLRYDLNPEIEILPIEEQSEETQAGVHDIIEQLLVKIRNGDIQGSDNLEVVFDHGFEVA